MGKTWMCSERPPLQQSVCYRDSANREIFGKELLVTQKSIFATARRQDQHVSCPGVPPASLEIPAEGCLKRQPDQGASVCPTGRMG